MQLNRLQRDYGIDGFKFDGGEMHYYSGLYRVHDPAVSGGLQSQLYSKFAVEYPVSEYRCAWQMGERLLVAPVQVKGQSERTVVIPPGRWRADDGAELVGPVEITVATPLERLPHFRLISK